MKQRLNLLKANNLQGLTPKIMVWGMISAFAALTLIACIMALFLAYQGWQISGLEKGYQQKKLDHKEVIVNLPQRQKQEQEYHELNQILKQALYKKQLIETMNYLSFSRAFEVLARSGIQEVSLRGFEFDNVERKLTFKGEALTSSAVMSWLLYLSHSPLFKGSQLSVIDLEESPQGYQFNVEGQL